MVFRANFKVDAIQYIMYAVTGEKDVDIELSLMDHSNRSTAYLRFQRGFHTPEIRKASAMPFGISPIKLTRMVIGSIKILIYKAYNAKSGAFNVPCAIKIPPNTKITVNKIPWKYKLPDWNLPYAW